MENNTLDFVFDRSFDRTRPGSVSNRRALRSKQSSNMVWHRIKQRELDKLKNKLENEKKSLVNDTYEADKEGYLTKDAVDKLNKKVQVIANLEQMIAFLEKGDLPSDITFVSSRAIKLRNKMFANFVLNSNSAYTITKENAEKVFAEEEPKVEVPIVNIAPPTEVQADYGTMAAAVDTSSDTGEVSLEESNSIEMPEKIERQAMSELVDAAFDKVQEDPVAIDESGPEKVTPEEVAEEVGRNDFVEEAKLEVPSKEVVIDNDIAKGINNNEPKEHGDFQKDIDEIFAKSIEQLKAVQENPLVDVDSLVSKTVPEVSKPKRAARKEWVPFTDEEIAKFQKDNEAHQVKSSISAEENEKEMEKVIEETPVTVEVKDDKIRDFVVVTPDREVLPSKKVVMDEAKEEVKDENLHFDVSDATPEDIDKVIDHEDTLEGFEELKRQVKKLKDRQRKSKKAMDEDERMAQNAAKRAEEALQETQAIDNEYEERMNKLRLYCEALEEDCNFNENRSKIAREDMKCNERFIVTQQQKAKEKGKKIKEIDSLIGPEIDPESVKVKGR